MRFERIPEEVEAKYFDGSHFMEVSTFLANHSIQAMVKRVDLPGPGRGMSDGLMVTVILDNRTYTVEGVVPLWIAITEKGDVRIHEKHEFEENFRLKGGRRE